MIELDDERVLDPVDHELGAIDEQDRSEQVLEPFGSQATAAHL